MSRLLAVLLAIYALLALASGVLPSQSHLLPLPSAWLHVTAGWLAFFAAVAALLPLDLRQRPRLTSLFATLVCLYLVFLYLSDANPDSVLKDWVGLGGIVAWPVTLVSCWLLALLALAFYPDRWTGRLVMLWAYFMMAAAALGVASSLLKLSLIYANAWLVPVRIPVGVALFALGAVLLARQQRSVADSLPERTREAQLINSIGLWLLIAIAFTTGLTSFIAVQSQVESSLYQQIRLTMNNRSIVFQNAIDAAHLDSAPLLRNTEIPRLLENPHVETDPELQHRLLSIAADNLPYTAGAIRFERADGKVAAQSGPFAPAETIWVDYRDKSEIRFRWRAGSPFIELHLRIDNARRERVGEAVVELPSHAWEQMLADTYDLGRTGEMLVCGVESERIRCMASRRRDELLRPEPGEAMHRVASNALDGETGFATDPEVIYDDQGVARVVSYGPVGRVGMALHISGNGLGMIIQYKAEEFYEPVRAQLNRVMPMLLAIIIGGSLLLRSLLLPLLRALRDKESRFRELTELSSDCYWLMDENLRFTDVTGKELSESGIWREHWLGRHWTQIPAHVDEPGMQAYLQQRLTLRQPFYDVVFRVTGEADGPRFINLSGAPLHDELGRFLGYRGVGSDITRRKLAEEGLREAQLGLEKRVQERTAELSESNRALAQEVQERRQAEERLKRSEARFRSLTELSSDWYWEQDEHYRFTQIAGEVDRKGGFSAAGSLGKTLWEQSWTAQEDGHWDHLRTLLEERRPFHDFVFKATDFDGATRYLSISGQPITDEAGRFRGFRGIGKDMTEQKLAQERIHFLAHYDALTHLPNRVLLADYVRAAIDRARRSGHPFALLFIDLDRFKIINDSLGHDAGDQVLSVVSQRLIDCVRDSDTVARLGGDEFVIVLENVAEPGQVSYTARRILEIINQPLRLAGEAYHVGASIGISVFPEDGETLSDLLKHADAAMYRAKEEGRNGIFFFSDAVNASAMALFRLESDLRQALEKGELILYYQPKLDLQKNAVSGVEALIRWRHPQRGMIPPAEFIPIAEDSGLINPIGDWVLQRALEQLAAWDRSGLPPLTMAVNLSTRQLQEGLPAALEAVLRDHRIAPHRLELELTESLMLQRPERDIQLLDAIKRAGVRISLDDFGTGFSSLSSLATLPLDGTKMDRSFVDRLPGDNSSASISRSILTMARGIGLTVVAEGVETEEQWRWLAEEGCHQIQGFRFCRPLPADEAFRFIMQHLETGRRQG